MGLAYEEYCDAVYERECVEYDTGNHHFDEVCKLTNQLSRVEYWAQAIDDDLRNENGVDIHHIDWMLEELFTILKLPISTKHLNIISGPQLAQVK
jgi:hypothetical protein